MSHWILIALGATAAALLWWPTDLILYADEPAVRRIFAQFRVGVVVVNVLLLLLGPPIPALRKRVELVVGLGLVTQSIWIGWCFGQSPGLVDTLFPFLYPTPMFTVVMLVPLRVRVVWVALSSSSAWLAAHLSHFPPDGEAWRQLNFMIFTSALALGLGQLVYSLALGQFVLRRRLAERGQELERLAGSLEERVAQQATLLLDLNRQAAHTRQAERERISRELHDGLGQDLTGARLVAGAMLATPDPAPALPELVGLLERSHQSLRRALLDLTPAALEEHGLVLAIRHMVEETATRAGLRAQVRLDPLISSGQVIVPAPVAVALFRVAQEALSNVVQHAEAHEVRVRLQRVQHGLLLEVSDDGVGLQRAPASPHSQFGLLGIRARVAALGGEVQLHSDQGTTVTVRLPLNPTPPETP